MKVLKECSSSLAKPMYWIFRQSLETSQIPSDWKQALVTNIFKKGSKSKVGNYRPISLTSISCKFLEAIIRENIIEFLNKNSIINPNQYAFLEGKSCLTNLLATFEDWTATLDEGYGLDIIYYKKTIRREFDTVPHCRLIKKLEAYGIQGKVARWVEAFLSARTQRVVLNGSKSEWALVLSGVRQGSVLGPLLFILYVNDIPDLVHCNIKMFADDIKLFTPVRSQEDQEHLQCDIATLENWTKDWLLEFNADKCKLMQEEKDLECG